MLFRSARFPLGAGGTVLQQILGFLAFVEMSLLSHLVGHLTLSLKGDHAVNAVLEDAAPRNRVLDSLTSLSFSQKPDFHIQMNVTFLRLSFFFLTSAFVLYLQSFSLRCRLHSK